LSAKLEELGIPQYEITPSVSIAVNGLLDHIEQLNKSLTALREQFESLQALVDVDATSTIPNRRALIKRLNWSIAMGKRYSGSATSLVSFSLSDYEQINRTYGYQAGARVAGHVAEFIAANIRDTDFFARINESQFGVIMYFAEFADVKTKAEKLCAELRAMPLRWNNGVINISLAYGVHAITAADDAETALLASLNAVFVQSSKSKFEQINFKT